MKILRSVSNVNNAILIALFTYLAPVTVIDFTKHLSKSTEPAECCNIESRFWRKLKERFHPEKMKSKSTSKRGMIGNIRIFSMLFTAITYLLDFIYAFFSIKVFVQWRQNFL